MQQETMTGSLFPLRVKCQNHERVPISPILVANVYSSCQDMDQCLNRGNRDPLSVFPWWSAKTMRGSLFPLFPLRVKCQNHERVPISPISSILVANVYSSCQDMDHQNRGNRDPFNVFPWWSAKSMRGSLFPLKGEMPKPWEGPYFPYFGGPMPCHLVKTWTTKIGEIGEIGTLSWFWHFTLRGNRGNRDPLSVFPWWSAKTMKGSLFPLFWWPMSIHPVKTWTTKIGEIGEIGPSHGFGTSPLGEIGEIGTLSVFSLDEVPKPWKGPYFPYFGGPCLDKMTRHGPPK